MLNQHNLTFLTDQANDPPSDHLGLARAGTGDDQQRAVLVQDGLAPGRGEDVGKCVFGVHDFITRFYS